MDSRRRIGLYANGEVPRSRRLSRRAVGPKSNGLRDLGAIPPVKRVRPIRLATKTVAAGAVGALAVLLIVGTAVVFSTSLVPAHILQPPPPPYLIVGYVYQSDGVTSIPGATVQITNLDYGGSPNQATVTTDPLAGNLYNLDLNTISGGVQPAVGNRIMVVGTSGFGTGSDIFPVPGGGFMWGNVTTGINIPEFGDLVVPIVGMLGMFAMVAVIARSKKNE